jgi:hypothetical protein
MPAPASRLALLRVALGVYSLLQLASEVPSLLAILDFLPRQFQPVGVATWLSQPLGAGALYGLLLAGLALGVCFTLGLAYSFTGPGFAVTLLLLTTYRSSWGMVLHTDNLITLHVMLLALAPASAALSFDARRLRARGLPVTTEAHGRFGWPLRAIAIATVTCYVLAGIAKLKLAGGVWLGGELLRTQIAYDNLRKLELGASIVPLGPWLVRHARLFPALAAATMLVELGAPLALAGKRWAMAWCLAAWGFHVGVLLTMSIGFPYQLTGLAYLAFFPVERLGPIRRWLARGASKVRPTETTHDLKAQI